jgi:hypothetical protein
VTRPTLLSTTLAALLVAGTLDSTDAKAVRLDPEAGGQALIYPYYTVRSRGTDPFNTYISIVNTSADGKALRVRFREGREGIETLGFNLFLSPNDTWTGALVPSADGGTQLVTADASCATLALPADAGGVNREAFSASGFPADGLDRTREGYVEVLEMGTVHGATLAAITQDGSGRPHDCGAVQLRTVEASDIGAPSGGLQGTLTLINVASGMDMTVDAYPLADLAHKAFYRPANNAYPDWDAAEIDPVSYIVTASHAYRLAWPNAVQAVESVLMRAGVDNEFVLDAATASSTDWIVTLPMRRFHVSASAQSAPFSAACEPFDSPRFDREARELVTGWCTTYNFDDCPHPLPSPSLCNAASVLAWKAAFNPKASIFGSRNVVDDAYARLPTNVGVVSMRFTSQAAQAGLVSLPSSSRMDLGSGDSEPGAYRVQGLPVLGFMARIFVNGTLDCGASKCQGNFASAFPHQGARSVAPAVP